MQATNIILLLLLITFVVLCFYLHLQQTKLKTEEKKAEEREKKLREKIKKAQDVTNLEQEVTRLQSVLDTTHHLIDTTNTEIASVSEGLQQKKEEYKETIQALNEAKVLLEKQRATILTNDKEIDSLAETIDSLKNSYRAALFASKREEEKKESGDQIGWTFCLEAHEENLTRILKGLMATYPDLETDFANIIWKKIWLPKIQKLAGQQSLDGKTGIYRLRLVDDESVAYVGQAVNIKERWYTHMKKMLGVEKTGNEKLYSLGYGPEKFIWELVEEVDKQDLDEREKFWIEWWGCKEWGLNKK